ncbi:MAG: phage major capsid protein [Acidimicrobiales bacterium]
MIHQEAVTKFHDQRVNLQLETEIRSLADPRRKLTPADEHRLASLTRDLSSVLGHPVSVKRGGQAVCISVDATPRVPRPPLPAARRRTRGIDPGIPVYELVPAGQAARSTPPRRTLPELRARAHSVLDRDALSDPDRLLGLPFGAIRDVALRSIEKYGQHLAPTEQDHLETLCRTRTAESDGRHFSRHIALTTSPAYRSAYEKSLRDAHPVFDEAEGAAINAWHQIAYRPTVEERAAGLGGTMGLGVPVMIDPTILVQTQDQAEILSVCGRALITTDCWKGVSSGGATLAFKSWGNAAADAAVTLAQPSIPIFSADGVFQASYELFADYPGLVDEVGNLFNGAYRDQISNYTSVGAGTGSSVPLGLFTAMSNQTTTPAHIKVTNAGSLIANDIRAVYAALPERYQLNASWLMSPSMVQAVAALAAPSVTSGLAPHDYVPASSGQPARLLGRPVVVSSYAPSFANATSGTFSWMVCGDFSRYLVVNRIGTALELIPNLPDQATGRPSGQRGYYYMVRWGAGVTDNLAFRILSNS